MLHVQINMTLYKDNKMVVYSFVNHFFLYFDNKDTQGKKTTCKTTNIYTSKNCKIK